MNTSGFVFEKHSFSAEIKIIGINPFVFLPHHALEALFEQAGKNKGKIPVRMSIDGHEFTQTLVKYSGSWRLYLNTPMRAAAKKQVGDMARFEIAYDSVPRIIEPHPELVKALNKNAEAKTMFENLSPSLQHEIVRYISYLKTDVSVERNVKRAINFLLGRERFVGRDKPA